MKTRIFHVSLIGGSNVVVELEAENCRKCGNNAVEFFDSSGGSVACMNFRADVEKVEVEGEQPA